MDPTTELAQPEARRHGPAIDVARTSRKATATTDKATAAPLAVRLPGSNSNRSSRSMLPPEPAPTVAILDMAVATAPLVLLEWVRRLVSLLLELLACLRRPGLVELTTSSSSTLVCRPHRRPRERLLLHLPAISLPRHPLLERSVLMELGSILTPNIAFLCIRNAVLRGRTATRVIDK